MIKQGKPIKGISKSEIVWTQVIGYDNTTYYVTSKPVRDVYYLYKMVDGKAERLGQSKSPISLEKKYITK